MPIALLFLTWTLADSARSLPYHRARAGISNGIDMNSLLVVSIQIVALITVVICALLGLRRVIRDEGAQRRVVNDLLVGDLTPIDIPAPPADLCQAIANGQCVLVLGSGMNAQAGLASWSSHLEAIIHETLEGRQLAQFRRLIETRPVDDVVDALRSQLPTGDLLRRIVQRIRSEKRWTHPTSYSILEKLPIAAVVSLNLDRLAVDAFRDRSDAVFSPRQAEPALDALSRNEFFVLTLNGSVDRPEDILLSHQNLKDELSRNDAFRDLLRRLYYSRQLFFLGVSLNGVENFLRAIDRSADPSVPHFALVEVTDSTWEPVAQNLRDQFHLSLMPFTRQARNSLDSFLRQILASIALAAVSTGDRGARGLVCIELRNIGPFSSCKLEFDRRWNALLGDNGVGKSSLLRAIAVAISGRATDGALARLLKSNASNAEIKLSIGNRDYLTTLKRRSGGGVEIQSHSGVPLELEQILVVGYPALRTVTGFTKRESDAGAQRPHIGDLAPLINSEPDPRLDGIKEWIGRIDRMAKSEQLSENERNRYSALYERIFSVLGKLVLGVDFKPKGVNPSTGEITIQTRDGPIPFESLSQGTLSLIGWTGALMQRLYEVAPKAIADPLHQPAVVIVDEIDAHMHPAWQQTIVGRLNDLFINTQFIVTSHSPLVVGGLEPAQVYRFERNDRGIVQWERPAHALKGMGVAGLLTSGLFGLESHLDIETADALRRKRILIARSLDEETPPEERAQIDEELLALTDDLKFVDSTTSVRDPLYRRFVEAVSRTETAQVGEHAPAVMTSSERARRSQIAEDIVRELRTEGIAEEDLEARSQ